MRRISWLVLAMTACTFDMDVNFGEPVITTGDAHEEPDRGDTRTTSGADSSEGDSRGDDSGGTTGTTGGESSEDGVPLPLFDVGSPDVVCPEPGADLATMMRFAVWVPVAGEVVKYQPDGLGYMLPQVGELARYHIGPGQPSPGGVSVALDGRSAVGSTYGVAVFESGAEGFVASSWKPCHESDGPTSVGSLQGSYWAAQALPWGDDVCLAWGVQLETTDPVAVAWTRGAWDAAACRYSAEIWAATSSTIVLLDGSTGDELASVALPVGPVGELAVDANGDAWGLVRGSSLFHVDHETMEVEVIPLVAPGTGWALSMHEGRPWVCDGSGAARWSGSTWETTPDWRDAPATGVIDLPGGAYRTGCSVHSSGELAYVTRDDDGNLYQRRITPDLYGYYGEPVPDDIMGNPRTWAGLSFDVWGSAWAVDLIGTNAVRLENGGYHSGQWLTGAVASGDPTGEELANVGGGL